MTAVTFANPDAIFTAKDIAAYRHVSENALAVERHRGDGPRYLKLGGRVFYRAADLETWIAENTITPPRSAEQQAKATVT